MNLYFIQTERDRLTQQEPNKNALPLTLPLIPSHLSSPHSPMLLQTGPSLWLQPTPHLQSGEPRSVMKHLQDNCGPTDYESNTAPDL